MSAKNQRQKWKTVSGTLNDPVGLEKFKEFQNKRTADTNDKILNFLEFYEKCDKHKQINDENQLRNSAESIFDEFLRDMAPKEIPDIGRNESSHIRNKLENAELSIEDLKTIFSGKQEDVIQCIDDEGSHDLFYKELTKDSSGKCTIY
ncbi:unnamed protein product [Meganyctiphanes norvegica]|uniref:RGS domain-containing protein n=1 Tax=Meganyctiphanes norvegica TaxID=48144 RepID=A0AAV2S9J2_MEGNR